MKWFKHQADSLDDPFIVELMDEFGHAGYTFYFGLIGIICQQVGYDLDKNFECSPIYLKRKLRISTTKVGVLLDFCQRKGKLIYDFQKEKYSISIPNIVKIKDNHTSNLQATGKKLSLDKSKKRKEKDKEENKAQEIWFEEIYKLYPNRDSKKESFKHFCSTVKTVDDFINIKKALTNYINNLKTEDWKKPKSAKTWFNNWEDWLEVEQQQSSGRPKCGHSKCTEGVKAINVQAGLCQVCRERE
jgi:tRNA A37 N6-isopentenylltransferase MiaA